MTDAAVLGPWFVVLLPAVTLEKFVPSSGLDHSHLVVFSTKVCVETFPRKTLWLIASVYTELSSCYCSAFSSAPHSIGGTRD